MRNILKIRVLLIFVVSAFTNVYAQPLDSLLQRAVENNPELKALQLEYESALEMKDQVSQLPNPQIGVGVPILRPETRLGPQIMMVSAQQMFPWFGTLKSKENVAVAMAKVKYERISALKLELFFKIKIAYYELCLIERKEEIVAENSAIYKTLEQLSLSKIESGKTSMADALRIQLKIREYQQELRLLENDKGKYYAQINELINNDPTTPILVEDHYKEVSEITINLEEYRSKIKEHHPLILQMDRKIEASKLEQDANRNMGRPSFGLGLDYALVSERTDMNPEFNGRDILIPKVMVSIPLYRKKYTAKNREEDLSQQAIEFQKTSLENKMLAMLQNYSVQYEQALLNIELLDEQIKIVQLTSELLATQYSVKGTGFDELLQIQNQLLMYELGLVKATIQTHKIRANIDRLTDF